MRLAMVVAMTAAAGAWGAQSGAAAAPSVTVCMDKPASISRSSVKAMTSRIFAEAGVGIDWHTSKGCPVSPGAITISFEEGTPRTERPGALAYAVLPQAAEGTHIVVFDDRVEEHAQAFHVPTLLAYVLVHEITHILQGIPRHSASGIMRAHWSEGDHFAMLRNTLTFTAYDEQLLHAGLDARLAGANPLPLATR